MATTPNYGWVTPAPTDFVTDLPADFEIFADAVDASFAADEGDLLVGGTSNIFEALPIGALGTVLTSDGDTAEWAVPAAGGGQTLISTTPFTSTSVTLSAIPADYKHLFVTIQNMDHSGGTTTTTMRLNGNTGNNYAWYYQHLKNDGGTSEDAGVKDSIKMMSISGNNGIVALNIPEYTTSFEHMVTGNWAWNNGNHIGFFVGYFNVDEPITSITFIRSAGTIDGTIKLYGVS
jgi:hypothetical protein